MGPLPSLATLGADWRELELRGSPSFFNSWTWIGTWLESLPGDVRPQLLRAVSGGRTVGLATVCGYTLTRGGVIRSKVRCLNSTGDPKLDDITIEYNDFLCETGCCAQVARACIQALLRDPRWDEFRLDGLSRVERIDDLAVVPLRAAHALRPDYYVDLAAMRGREVKYIDVLPQRIRSQLRRATKECEERGPLSFEIASTLPEAEAFMSELKRLHVKSWRARNKPGAFANPFLDAFHAKLLRQYFSTGAIQVSRLRVGEHSVGYLYNFVHDQRVFAYQSGFDWEFDARTSWRPGLLSHYFAIEACNAQGLAAYNFMAGDQQYKRQMSTAESKMAWLVLQRPRFKFRVESALRSFRGKMNGLRARRTGPAR